MIPQTAINYSLYGNTVYVVEPGKLKGDYVANQVHVTLGETKGDMIVVSKGLQVGNMVVSGGQLKIHNGSSVRFSQKKVSNQAMTQRGKSADPSKSLSKKAAHPLKKESKKK